MRRKEVPMKKGIENGLLFVGGMLIGSGLATAYQDYKKKQVEEPTEDDFDDDFEDEFDDDLDLDDDSDEEKESSEEDQ